MPIVWSRSAHGVRESKCSKRPSHLRIYLDTCDSLSSSIESSSLTRAPFVCSSPPKNLSAGTTHGFSSGLELSCSCLLGKSFCQLHGQKLCHDGIRQVLTRHHSTHAAMWNIRHALPSWPQRVLETWRLFMCNYAATWCVLEVRRLIEAGI